MSELSALCESRKVRAVVKYGVKGPIPEWASKGPQQPWTVTLHYNGRRLTVPFFSTSEPTPADVLGCLLSDTSSVENARSFEEWASDLGFNDDSRTAEQTYKACKRIALKVRRFLGDDLETFGAAEH